MKKPTRLALGALLMGLFGAGNFGIVPGYLTERSMAAVLAQKVGDRHLTPTEAGQLSILFDVGGVLGGALAGHLSDVTGASAVVSSSFVWLTIPVLWLYRHYGSVSFTGALRGVGVGLVDMVT